MMQSTVAQHISGSLGIRVIDSDKVCIGSSVRVHALVEVFD